MKFRDFYMFGMWCFIVIGGANVWGFVIKLQNNTPMWEVIVAFGTVALNFGFAYFFYWLSKQQQGQPQVLESFDFSEANKLYEEAKSEETNNKNER